MEAHLLHASRREPCEVLRVREAAAIAACLEYLRWTVKPWDNSSKTHLNPSELPEAAAKFMRLVPDTMYLVWQRVT